MSRKQRTLIAVEIALAALVGLLAIVSLLWRDWIELVFRWDPDHHGGSAELLIIVGLAAVSLVLGAAARWQTVRYRRVAAAAQAG